MEKRDSFISFLMEECILDEATLESVISQHEKTGQSLVAILKKDDLLDEERFSRSHKRA